MKPAKRVTKALREFIDSEAAGGLVLMFVAALALIIANSSFAGIYFSTLRTHIGGLSVLHWINDGLMALFFLLVGLEIKREFAGGELASWRQRALPAIAALGGMAVPALIYVYFNSAAPETLAGWAIPCATDIAFALGILALLGNRVPMSLKVFLAALAIIDDLGAVVIIALFYTTNLDLPSLCGVGILTVVLAALNYCGVKRLPPYLLIGLVLWYFMFKSGIHATLAGVVLALAIPVDDSPRSPLHILEHAMQKSVAFIIVPVFGFANAGVSLTGLSLATLIEPVTLGVAAGLFVGKQIGVFSFAWLTIHLGLTQKPKNASWPQIYGVSILCGVGFTMSLFIGLLAFPGNEANNNLVKVGVLLGSIASGVMGAAFLILARSDRSIN
jgi:Na+:H+ antiporter, NhaA family